jgi:putative ABC transport system permease protein
VWIALTVLVAVLGATAAAWWPGRAVSRLPVMVALSGRPPKPRPARHAAIAAGALIAVGIGSLAFSGRDAPPLIIVGIVATIVGCLLLGPLAIRIFSGLAGRLSVAPRLALRDLVRYQARSGAALAAVTLALGIAATVAVIASAEEAQSAGAPPNLADRQIRVYLGPPRAKEVISMTALTRADPLAASVRELATQLDGATVTPLRRIIQPGTRSMFDPFLNTRVLPPVELVQKSPGPHYRPAAQLYVATPAVLRYLGIDPATVKPGTDFLVDRSARVDDLVIPSFTSRKEYSVTNVQRIDASGHLFGSPFPEDSEEAGAPAAFITLDGLRRRGWKQVPGGWLVDSDRPLTSDQIAGARDLAAEAGLTIEIRREGTSYAKAIGLVIGAGGLLALAILAMTVGLIRAESAGDVRTLTATGATARIRRTLTATTAGALALLGALLGVAGAYVVLMATFYDDLGYLSDVPFLYLGLVVVGVPLAAAAAGWLIAGREPPAVARAVLE